MYRHRAEQAEQRKMDFYAKEVERIDHPRRASLELSVVFELSTEEKEREDQPSARDSKRACGEPEQDLSGEIPIPCADGTLTTPRDSCCAIWCDSVKFEFNSDLSGSLVKQW